LATELGLNEEERNEANLELLLNRYRTKIEAELKTNQENELKQELNKKAFVNAVVQSNSNNDIEPSYQSRLTKSLIGAVRYGSKKEE
jgi:hypothetical protein